MNTPLVSILVPCYNMEGKISRMLESIIVQTYKNLHVVIVDDGSTDNSKQEILSFTDKMKDSGIEFEYIYQKNKGLGGAINTGLKHIKGTYFCWPDADDILTRDSIEKRVFFLENNPTYAFVRSDAAIFYESDLVHPVGCITKKSPNRFKEYNLMEDYILERDIIFCPGCHMVKTSAFKEVNPKMDIYEGRRGQNYQMLLPLVYKFKFGYIDECLYKYVVYSTSMSRGDDTFEKWLERYDGLKTYILETLNRMDMNQEDYNYYTSLTHEKYYRLKAIKALEFGLKKEYLNYRKKLTNPQLLLTISRYDILANIPAGFFMAKVFYIIKRKLQGIEKINKFYKKIKNALYN